MAFMNYSGSLRYDMQGRKRKAYKKNNPTKKKQGPSPKRTNRTTRKERKENQTPSPKGQNGEKERGKWERPGQGQIDEEQHH